MEDLNKHTLLLFFASQDGHVQLATRLLQIGARVNGTNSDGSTALMIASHKGHLEVATELLKSGASVNLGNSFNAAPLTVASLEGHVKVVAMLSQNGTDVNMADSDGRTPLMIASECGHVEVVMKLLEIGVSVDKTDNYGLTPLMLASQNGHIEVVTELLKHGADVNVTDANMTAPPLVWCSVIKSFAAQWTITQLLQVPQNRVLQNSTFDKVGDVPDWFIPPHELDIVQVRSKSSIQTYEATPAQWLNSVVQVSEFQVDQAKFVDAVDQWIYLGHPNVVNLSGAIHLKHPYTAVFENASYTNLLDYLAVEGNRQRLWQKLHEVALGLKYLHNQGIVLEYFNCQHIWVGTDGTAKINGFGIGIHEKDSAKNSQADRWRSLEVLRGSQPSTVSNVFSFAMCIHEAVTGKQPWNSQDDRDIVVLVNVGHRPEIPDKIERSVAKLIKLMWCDDPSTRMNLSIVIEHLKNLSEPKILPKDTTANAGSNQISIASLPAVLDDLQFKCRVWPASQASIEHIINRLRNIYEILRQQHKTPTDFVVMNYCQVLKKLNDYLCVARDNSVLQRAKSQIVWLQYDVFHRDIDEVLHLLLPSGSEGPVHKWTEQAATRNEDIKNMNSAINRLQKKSAVKTGAVQILRFEPDTLNKRFQTVDRSEVGMCEAQYEPWFIPTHQLKCNRDHPIGTGAFAKVYKATWLGTPVVIKLVGYEADGGEYNRELFFHELQVWFPLNHPHVIKLFGACHVGKRFFACEYAGNGTLDTFLKNGDNSNQKWRKLHQVALGLQYLHSLSIVHNGLKCDNILIGANGDAKITDFGLSCIPNCAEVKVEKKKIGAVQWKLPEYLRGDRLTVASDLYAFGMCILEAVSGDYPWGQQIDASVRFHVRKGSLPKVSMGALTATERTLVEMICVPNPSERITILSVVERLAEFAKAEDSAASRPRSTVDVDAP